MDAISQFPMYRSTENSDWKSAQKQQIEPLPQPARENGPFCSVFEAKVQRYVANSSKLVGPEGLTKDRLFSGLTDRLAIKFRDTFHNIWLTFLMIQPYCDQLSVQ